MKNNIIKKIKDCPGCAKRRAKLKRAFHILVPKKVRVQQTHTRLITMPWHMDPEWLPSNERDGWIARRNIALATMGFKGKAGLRKYQRGSIGMMAGAGTMAAGGDCTYTASTVPALSDFTIEPANAFTRARLHSDGDWYWAETNSWGTSDGTWQGGCAVADYDTRWTQVSGTTPNSVVSGTDGTWSAATTSKAVGYDTNFGIKSGSFTLECRDGTSLNTLFTDSFTMSAEVDSKN